MQAATPRFPASRAVTVASDWPSSSARVRVRCVARSRSPRLNHVAAPVPPASVRTRMSVAEVLAKGPQRGAATPCIETRSRSTREIGRQGALGDGNEAETHPDPVEALRAREECDDPRGAGVIEDGGDELRGD